MQMKKPVSAPSVRNTAMAFAVEIPADKEAHYSSQHKNIQIVYRNGGLQSAIKALADTTADLYVLALHSDTSKLNAWLQQVRDSEAELVVGEATATQNKRTEWLGGFRAAEVQAPWILLRGENWKRANFDQVSDPYSLLYVLEKQGLSQENVPANTLAAATWSAGMALSAKFRTALRWYNPVQNLRSAGLRWQGMFTLLALLLLFLMPIMSRQAGISGDEITQYEYSRLTANYYQDLIGMDIEPVDSVALKGQKMKTLASKADEDPAALATIEDPEKLMHLYGSSFDTFSTLIIRLLGTDDIYETRHMLNSLFGWICMFFAALIVRRLSGSWVYAFLALLLLFFTPRLLGESFNNPKDVPFAAGYTMALYYMLRAFPVKGPRRISHAVGLMFGIALAISIRVGGIILLPMVVMYAGLQFIAAIGWKSFIGFKWTGFTPLLRNVALIALGGYLLGVIAWPYGLQSPLENPLAALSAFSNYSGSLRQLFEGKMYDSDLLPSHYLSKYIMITTPIVTLIGALIFIAMLALKPKQLNNGLFLLFFAAVFPVLYIYIQKSNVYGGLRHVLFVIPALTVVGVLGWKMLEERLAPKGKLALAAPLAMGGLTFLPALFTLQNHPLQYVYFNELTGGVKGAYGKYEMDYYLASLKQSSEWLLENEIRKNPTRRYTILTYGMDQVRYYFRNDTNVHVGYTRYDDRSRARWDYAIFFNAYMDQERLMNGYYPPAGTVFSPMVAGKPMGIVIKRPSTEDYEGSQALKAAQNMQKQLQSLADTGDLQAKIQSLPVNYRNAIGHFNNYLKVDSGSCEVYQMLSEAYEGAGNADSSLWAARKSAAITPDYTPALSRAGVLLMNKGKLDEAYALFNKVNTIRPKDGASYFYLAQVLAQQNQLDAALQKINQGITMNQTSPEFYNLGAMIYQALGNKEMTQLYQQAVRDDNAKGQILGMLGVTNEE